VRQGAARPERRLRKLGREQDPAAFIGEKPAAGLLEQRNALTSFDG
jgi:hypothetical protein